MWTFGLTAGRPGGFAEMRSVRKFFKKKSGTEVKKNDFPGRLLAKRGIRHEKGNKTKEFECFFQTNSTS